MFGFQRVADLIWQGADCRARGFLLGATGGRTTSGNGKSLRFNYKFNFCGISMIFLICPSALRAPVEYMMKCIQQQQKKQL